MSYWPDTITKENSEHEILHSNPEEDLTIVDDISLAHQSRREIFPMECHP